MYILRPVIRWQHSRHFFLDHLGESEKLSAPLTAGALAAAHSVRDLAAVGSKKGVREKIIEEMAGDENM